MKKLVYLIVIVGIAAIIGYSMSGSSDEESYRNEIADIRGERVRFLKNSKNSPFKEFGVKYHPQKFFPIDRSYKVRANLERIDNPVRTTISNSDGTSAPYTKFAYATFSLQDQPLKLLILKPAGFGALPNTYFTAFADETSSKTTYGGGRYLDLQIGKSNNIEIDFNLSYNPYCAYVEDYSCPLPPPENTLPVSIEAGEKDYNH